MESGITTTPIASALAGLPLSVEYSLSLADHHALDMFIYDTVIRKTGLFRLRFYAINLLQGGAVASIAGLMLWGLFKAIGVVSPTLDARAPLHMGYALASIVLAVYLIGIIPGSFLHRMVRNRNDRRFWHARRTQLRAGLLRYPQRYRVDLTPEGFTETISYRETGIAVSINEHKETRVWWAAVASIDLTAEHAFFTVKDKGWLILPRRAFVEEASFLEFVDMAKSYCEVSRLAPSPRAEPFLVPETRIKDG